MAAEDSPIDLAILGAGAAGMMAAIAAGEVLAAGRGAEIPRGPARIVVFEKNVRAGIKVLVCGGGRCNFTNDGSARFLIEQFGRNGRFLTPALEHLDNAALRQFFAALGVPSHVEPGGKVYPDSNQAKSVVDALVRRMRELGVEVLAGASHALAEVVRKGEGFALTTAGGQRFAAGMVLIAVGGMSYQRMGTVGDGYRLAEALGHTVVTPRPAIVGLITQEPWPMELPGLAVRDVEVTLAQAGKVRSVGDMLLTHFGLSGPAILNPSEIVAELLERHGQTELLVDLARHVPHAAAHDQLRQWQQTQGKKLLRKVLAQTGPEIVIRSTSPDQTAVEESVKTDGAALNLPARLAEKVLELEGIGPEQTCATLTTGQMHRLVERVKRCPFTITATRGFKEAMVTAGGVKLGEVNPRTMESKRVPNLFLAGEVLDLTGPSGGYNLQLAFSTGHLAGTEMGRRLAKSWRRDAESSRKDDSHHNTTKTTTNDTNLLQ